MVMSRSYALSREEIIRALTAYTGITTADGAVTNDTLVDAVLIGATDWITGKTILIDSGPSERQDRGALSFNPATGEITVVSAFTDRIMAGTIYRLLNISSTILTQIEKLAGQAPVASSTTANWNAGEADIVSIGANDTKYKLHSLMLDINALTGTVTIRMYSQINGVERRVYQQSFTVSADGPGLWIVNGTVAIHEVLRVTAQSSAAGDDGKAIGYDYMLEAM